MPGWYNASNSGRGRERVNRGGRSKRSGVRPLGPLVEEGLAGLGIAQKIREHTAPLVWAEVVGPQVAGATEALGVERGVLRIATKSAVWSHELTFYKADILRRLNARLGAAREPIILDIRFQNRSLRKSAGDGDAGPRLAPTPEELDDVTLSPAEMATIEAGVAGVTDEHLRARLRRVRIADARLRTWRLDNNWLPCPRCGDLAPSDPDLERACPRCRVEEPSRNGGSRRADSSGA